eukprot:scaffold178176_cov17-Tisochrysis_lutea.AAC.2
MMRVCAAGVARAAARMELAPRHMLQAAHLVCKALVIDHKQGVRLTEPSAACDFQPHHLATGSCRWGWQCGHVVSRSIWRRGVRDRRGERATCCCCCRCCWGRDMCSARRGSCVR